MKKVKFTGSTCGELADWLDAEIELSALTSSSARLRSLASGSQMALRLSGERPAKHWRDVVRTYESAIAKPLPKLELRLSGADAVRRSRRTFGRVVVTATQKSVLEKLGNRIEIFEGIPCIVAKPGEAAK